ncbi:MAG: M28 family peptidase [Elusimicrobia bacterium]|nr:M28 family peptidase [Elusimicrobiota bacterium]
MRPIFLVGVLASLGLLSVGVFLYVRRPLLSESPRRAPAGADAARLRRHVEILAAMTPRDSDHPRILDRAARYVSAELRDSGARMSEQAYAFDWFDQRNRKQRLGPFRNIIASFGPDTAERVVVGAHYDAFGPFPGADDNASGVAVLLEAGRLLGREPLALRVDLVAFTLEEPPFFATPHMGSARHAVKLKEEGVRVRAMLSLEMLGRYSDAPGSQATPSVLLKLLYPSAGDFVAVVTDHASRGLAKPVKAAMSGFGLPVYSITAPASVPGIDYSDHSSYWDQGYPAVMVTDTAFYRNKDYHTPKDTPERLDYARMALAAEGVVSAVRGLAKAAP